MKKFLTLAIISTLSFSAFSEERDFRKNDANSAIIIIKTDESNGAQAAQYVDGKENKAFINMLLQDKNSELAKLKTQIEQKNCDETSSGTSDNIPGCGRVIITSETLTGFGRGGWSNAGAQYNFFVGFEHEGTARFFEATHSVTFIEEVIADVDLDDDYLGSMIKRLKFSSINKL